MVAPRCDDRLALVAGCDQRDEGGVECPRWARVKDEDLGAVAEGRLVRVPGVEELEERGLVRRARQVIVHVVGDRVDDQPLVRVRAAGCLDADVPESVDLERVTDFGRSMESGRPLHRRCFAQVGRNCDHVRVDEARRCRRYRLEVEGRGGAGEASEPSRVDMHLRCQEQVLVVRWHIHDRDLVGLA